MKRVGLLTLPLKDNYGGILQAVALTECLQRLGCDVVLIQKEFHQPLWKRVITWLLERLPFQNVKKFRSRYRNGPLHKPFINEMIPQKTPQVISREELGQVARDYEFDAVVVGSDQVWRLEYIDKAYYGAYFLDFLEGTSVKRVAYAPSFGLDYWEAPEKAKEVSAWLQGFDALSVRESSGQKVCAGFGRADAVHVVDPTVLVGRDFYFSLIRNLQETGRGGLLYYVLDPSDVSEKLLSSVCSELGEAGEVRRIYDRGTAFQSRTVPAWVKAFAEAQFVLTDSFHGMVFAVLFNKHFVAIANQGRGASRFESFLARLELQERLVTHDGASPVEALVHRPIDYDAVNARIASWREESEAFLRNALKL